MIAKIVSIIMPVYNGRQHLACAIESALNQTYPDIQLIIVNDGSDDGSENIINKYLHDSRVTYVSNHKNMGVARTRNVALEHATGEFVSFHDQDDIWLPNKLSLQISALNLNPTLGLLHAQYARVDSDGMLLSEYIDKPSTAYENSNASVEVGDVLESIFVSNDIQPLTSIIPKNVLDEVGWFNPDLPGVDDYELWLRIAYRYPIGQLKTIVGYWRKHAMQQSNNGRLMQLTKLKAIDVFLDEHPKAKNRISRNKFIKRMHGMNQGSANHYFYDLQDYKTAKLYYRKALKFKYYDLNSWFKLIYCIIPKPIQNSLRLVKKRLLQ